jgi:hypothetical protein
MKTREEIIYSMCLTMRHDYGLTKEPVGSVYGDTISFRNLTSGMSPDDRESLWSQMAQLFDNDIAPYMEFKK